MIFQPQHRFLPHAAAAVAFAASLAACSGASNSGTAIPLTQQAGSTSSTMGRATAPAPTNTEFFNGITPNSTPRGIAAGPGGMWFTQPGANQIARIDTTGTVTEFTAPTTGVNNIVKGPDGNLWFTQSSADSVGRMTPHGRVTQFSVGNEAYGPFDITLGSDGNLWFTFRSPSTNAIGRITPSGASTLFTSGLSPGDVAVHDVTTGPDGNVWFTEEFGNRIGRITPSGVITEFSSGITAGAGLVDITAGPDGNVWFTENSINQIGRITPSGTVTEFSRGITPNSAPGSITAAKGFVWFTESGGSRLGRVNMTGHIAEYSIPAALASDIAPNGSSNSLWITDYTGNGIVHFTP